MAYTSDLKQLIDQVAEINHLIKRAELTQLTTIGHSMTHVVNSIVDVGHASKRLLAVLRLHSQAIAATVKGEKSAAAMVSNALGRAVKVVQAVNKEAAKPAAA